MRKIFLFFSLIEIHKLSQRIMILFYLDADSAVPLTVFFASL